MDDVILVAGTLVEHLDTDGVWKRVPRLTSTGDTGSMSEAKDKSTIEDRIARYGSGRRDGGDKTLNGQRIPEQLAGSEHFVDYGLQQNFIDRCKNEEEMQLRITWPDFERAESTFKPLGYMVNGAGGDEWKTFTINGKQNSFVDWQTAPVLTAVDLGDDFALAVDAGAQLSMTNTPANAYYNVNEDTFSSSDTAVATVTKWGYVKALSAGTATLTVVRKTNDDTTPTVTDTVTVTVS